MKKVPKKPIPAAKAVKLEIGLVCQASKLQALKAESLNNNHRASLQLYREDPWGWAHEMDKKGLPIAKMITDLLANNMIERASLGTWRFVDESKSLDYGGGIQGYKITEAGKDFARNGKK